MVVDTQLIFDAGMNDGEDTLYYLKKGFNVVAIEANPALCAHAQTRFAPDIGSGRLNIVSGAISDKVGDNEFYINETNHHWSSLDPSWALKERTEVSKISVPGVHLGELFERYGVPHYLKIDIEGADMLCLRQLADCLTRPAFLSIEDCRFGFDYVEALVDLGYVKFMLSDQHAVGGSRDEAVDHTFRPGASGPFGEFLEGEWLDHRSFLDLYEKSIRDRSSGQRKSPPAVWWDIHAAQA